MQTVDFCRSFMRFRIDPSVQPPITVTRPMPTKSLSVRIGLECRCELKDLRTGVIRTYVLGASCKTELVGAARNIWMEPNADFCVVMSEEDFMVLKSFPRNHMPLEKHPDASASPVERQSGSSTAAWAEYGFELPEVRGRALSSIDEIITAIQGSRPLVSRTAYDDENYHVVIDHPVKTVNYCDVNRVYQTDTGPILLPDLSAERAKRSERFVERFDLAYAAFNSANWAEFIINVPTPIGAGLSINHYSRTRRIEPVMNSLFELTDELPPFVRHVGAERGSRVDAAELQFGINGAPREARRVREKQ